MRDASGTCFDAFYATWLVSVWCYLAAVLSGVVLLHFMLRRESQRAMPA